MDDDNKEYKDLKKADAGFDHNKDVDKPQESKAPTQTTPDKKLNLNKAVTEEIANGNIDAKKIAEKYGAKLASVKWYLAKFK